MKKIELDNPINWIDPFTVERYKEFTTFIKENQTILDFGCHTGRGGEVIKKVFPTTTLYGIELSEEAVKLIPKNIYKDIFNFSIANLNDSSLKFDRIVAGEVIEHIPKDQFQEILEKCNQMLKDDGLIIFTTPNPNFLLVKLGRDAVLKDETHINIMSVKEFKDSISKSGLKIINISGSGKSTRYIGNKIPFINLYGSYLAVLCKKK